MPPFVETNLGSLGQNDGNFTLTVNQISGVALLLWSDRSTVTELVVGVECQGYQCSIGLCSNYLGFVSFYELTPILSRTQ